MPDVDATFGTAPFYDRIHRVAGLNCSNRQVLGVPDVDATFGTAPEFWNSLLETIVKVRF